MGYSESNTTFDGGPTRHLFAPNRSPSLAVIDAVSSASETPAEQLPVLYDVIDPDALDALFGTRADDRSRFGGFVSFTYAGYDVTIGNGSVSVQAATE